jgi:isopenicillin N synthase-like dioxygenase
LQALIQEEWTLLVPYVEGALVVNIGSLLSDWTNGKLLATLHQVISLGESKPWMPLAFFANPDKDILTSLKNKKKAQDDSTKQDMSVAEYIQWRGGGVVISIMGWHLQVGRETSEKGKTQKKG